MTSEIEWLTIRELIIEYVSNFGPLPVEQCDYVEYPCPLQAAQVCPTRLLKHKFQARLETIYDQTPEAYETLLIEIRQRKLSDKELSKLSMEYEKSLNIDNCLARIKANLTNRSS